MRYVIVLIGVGFLIVAAWMGALLWQREYTYDVGCGEYMERAGAAPTVAIAIENVDRIRAYADKNGLTSGNTGILLSYPSNDVEYWRRQLEGARDELVLARDACSSLSETNALLKLREVIHHHPNAMYSMPDKYFVLGMWVALWVLTAIAAFSLLTAVFYNEQ